MIYLYVSTFGNDISWIKFNNPIPIEVGSACRDEQHPLRYRTRDDINNNISKLNPYYGELTGVYYLWKNMKFNSQDIIGFAHYNKVLFVKSRKIKKMLSQKSGWIVRKPEKIKAHSYPNDVKILREVLKKDFPSYYIAWEYLYTQDGASKEDRRNCISSQMFFTTKGEFEQYCNFLFSVLDEVYEKIGNVKRDKFHKRYCAFLGERLLSVYLLTNNSVVYNVPTMYKGGTSVGVWLQDKLQKHNMHLHLSYKLKEKIRPLLLGVRNSSYKNNKY